MNIVTFLAAAILLIAFSTYATSEEVVASSTRGKLIFSHVVNEKPITRKIETKLKSSVS